jgi:glycosyltransferase involved in cell wall biosynthesis
VLGFLGSFYRYEGLHLLIQAMPRLLAQNPDIRLLLVGGGEATPAAPDDLDLGLSGAVVFAGRGAACRGPALLTIWSTSLSNRGCPSG